MSNRNFTLHPSAAKTASFNSASVKATSSEIAFAIDVTATSGTPTLDIEVEYSPDGTNWVAAATPQTIPQISATGVSVARFEVQAKYYRLAYTIAGGTPSLTFIVVATHFDYRK